MREAIIAVCRSCAFWRNIHRFILWFPVALFSLYGGIMVIAATASGQNADAKTFVAGQIVMWRAIVTAPYLILWCAGLVAIWLAAFLWSGHMFEKADRAWNPAPVERQARKRAKSPLPADHRRLDWLKNPLPFVAGLRAGLAGSADQAELEPEARRTVKPPPRRDASLASGLVYALTGSWELSVLATLLNEANIDGFNYRKKEFER
ncbi:MAG: hypothetical protein ABIP91_06165, partial [Sphingomicrobium sp.]